MVYWDKAAISHRKPGPGDPDRNLGIYQGLLAQGKTLSPGSGSTTPGSWLPTAGRRRPLPSGRSTWPLGRAGWKTSGRPAGTFPPATCARARGEEAFRALAKALRLGPPRAELCCDFGAFFLEHGDYPAAAFWYEAALTRPREDRSGAFVSPDCYGYLPCIQLCVCYYRMGDVERSREYNRRAGQYKPQDPAFLYNQRFFQGKGEAHP